MFRQRITVLAIGLYPAFTPAQAQQDHGALVLATGHCLVQAARKFDDRTSDPSLIARKINVVCQKEWEAQGPSADPLTGPARTQFEATRDKMRQEEAVYTVQSVRRERAK